MQRKSVGIREMMHKLVSTVNSETLIIHACPNHKKEKWFYFSVAYDRRCTVDVMILHTLMHAHTNNW